MDEYGTKFGPIVLLRSTLDQAGWEALESDLTAVFEELTTRRTTASRSTATT